MTSHDLRVRARPTIAECPSDRRRAGLVRVRTAPVRDRDAAVAGVLRDARRQDADPDQRSWSGRKWHSDPRHQRRLCRPGTNVNNLHPSIAAVEWLNIATSMSYVVGAVVGPLRADATARRTRLRLSVLRTVGADRRRLGRGRGVVAYASSCSASAARIGLRPGSVRRRSNCSSVGGLVRPRRDGRGRLADAHPRRPPAHRCRRPAPRTGRSHPPRGNQRRPYRLVERARPENFGAGPRRNRGCCEPAPQCDHRRLRAGRLHRRALHRASRPRAAGASRAPSTAAR